MSDTKPILSMQNIGKAYGSNQVLQNVSVDIMPGEIYALCGENGAGKSTLMNILFGMPVITKTGGFTGKILINGEEVKIHDSSDAIRHGIGMVHQEFLLIPGFTVGENIKLNREPLKKSLFGRILGRKMDVIDFDGIYNDSAKTIERLDVTLNEKDNVAGLPVGYMQFVEIAKEVDKQNLKLLILDEPTAVLTESEAAVVLNIVKNLSREGIAVLLITHRIDEIMSVADTVTILRDGVNVKTMPIAETTAGEIAQLMVGRSVELEGAGRQADDASTDTEKREIAVKVRDLSVDMPGETVDKASFDLYKGEILGLGGLAGQGKLGIANGLMGLYPTTGTVEINGKPLELNSPKASIAAGLGFVSEDRRKQGFAPDLSIEDNIVTIAMANKGMFLKSFGLFKLADKKKIREAAEYYIKEFEIRCTGPEQPVGRLSGGNQQKVCIAKALMLAPDILLVSEPTRGIDIGAKELVLHTISKLNKEKGMTILFTSSELNELRQICDRIGIVSGGRIVEVLPPNASNEQYGLAMARGKED